LRDGDEARAARWHARIPRSMLEPGPETSPEMQLFAVEARLCAAFIAAPHALEHRGEDLARVDEEIARGLKALRLAEARVLPPGTAPPQDWPGPLRDVADDQVRWMLPRLRALATQDPDEAARLMAILEARHPDLRERFYD
jgi:hypothetical protein